MSYDGLSREEMVELLTEQKQQCDQYRKQLAFERQRFEALAATTTASAASAAAATSSTAPASKQHQRSVISTTRPKKVAQTILQNVKKFEELIGKAGATVIPRPRVRDSVMGSVSTTSLAGVAVRIKKDTSLDAFNDVDVEVDEPTTIAAPVTIPPPTREPPVEPDPATEEKVAETDTTEVPSTDIVDAAAAAADTTTTTAASAAATAEEEDNDDVVAVAELTAAAAAPVATNDEVKSKVGKLTANNINLGGFLPPSDAGRTVGAVKKEMSKDSVAAAAAATAADDGDDDAPAVGADDNELKEDSTQQRKVALDMVAGLLSGGGGGVDDGGVNKTGALLDMAEAHVPVSTRRASQIALREQLNALTKNVALESDSDDDDDSVVAAAAVPLKPSEVASGHVQEEEMTDDDRAMLAIADELQSAQMKLPELVALLEKQSPRGLRPYQKRYVAVYDYNIYYSKAMFTAADVEKEAGRENSPINCLPLVVVSAIERIDRGRELSVEARDPRSGKLRKYKFRCTTTDECTMWVRGLNEHKNHLLSMLRWVALNKSNNVEISWNQ